LFTYSKIAVTYATPTGLESTLQPGHAV
jgi:hypothetical protein